LTRTERQGAIGKLLSCNGVHRFRYVLAVAGRCRANDSKPGCRNDCRRI
jgi:hypothetical protein